MKVMSFSSGGRTRHIYGWVSIIWFTSAVSITASEEVEPFAPSELAARCGDNVSLTCVATLPDKSHIKHFAWEAGNKRCQIDDDKHDSEFRCESTVNNDNHTLTLTLLDVTPVNKGEYLCKLRTVQGTKSTTTVVKVHDCFGSSNSSISDERSIQKPQKSPGNMVKLQWICIMVEFMMVKFMS